MSQSTFNPFSLAYSFICSNVGGVNLFTLLLLDLVKLSLLILWQPSGNLLATIWQPSGNRLATNVYEPFSFKDSCANSFCHTVGVYLSFRRAFAMRQCFITITPLSNWYTYRKDSKASRSLTLACALNIHEATWLQKPSSSAAILRWRYNACAEDDRLIKWSSSVTLRVNIRLSPISHPTADPCLKCLPTRQPWVDLKWTLLQPFSR